MARVLCTGAAGFMGRWLCDQLLLEGHDVVGVDDLSDGDIENVEDFDLNANWSFHEIDLANLEAVQVFAQNQQTFDVVYHLAADATEGRSQFTPLSCTQNNLIAFQNLIVSLLQNCGFGHLVTVTSMSVYGNGEFEPPFQESFKRLPVDVYGWNKAMMEGVTETLSDVYDFTYTIVRPHNVYGEWQSRKSPYRNVLAIWINRLLRKKNLIIYGDGQQSRAFSYVGDITPALTNSGFFKDSKGEIINLGAQKAYTLEAAAHVVLDKFFDGKAIPDWAMPEYIEDRPREVKHAFCTVQKSIDILGYRDSTPFEEGIQKMVEWMKEVGPKDPEFVSLEITNDKTPKPWSEESM